MLTNARRDRLHIQVEVSTTGALGETVVWKPVETRYALVTPLDAKARAVYQQLERLVTHKVEFRGVVSLNLGNNRFLWNDKTLTPVEPAQKIGNATVVIAKEE